MGSPLQIRPRNALLSDAPGRITLTFTEPVEAASASVRLLATGNQQVPLSTVPPEPETTRQITVQPQQLLGGGDYVVVWSARAARDGTPFAGAYPFRAGAIDNPGAAQLPGAWPAPWAIALRWLVFLGTALAGGGFAWSRLLAPVRRSPDSQFRVLAMTGGALTALLATLLSPLLHWRLDGDRAAMTTLTTSLRALPLGWWVQAVALVMLTFLCLGASADYRSPRGRSEITWAGLGTGLTALLGFSFTAHAAAARDAVALALEVVHQWSTALWIAGLFYLAVGWRDLGSDVARFRAVRWIGGLLFAVSVTTGLALATPFVPSLEVVVTSRYGQVLAGKTVIVLIILALGLLALVVPRHTDARHASGSFTGQGVAALAAALCAAMLALLTLPGTTTTDDLAGVDLVDVVPLDASAYGVEGGLVHLLAQPTGADAQTVVVRVTDDEGFPLVADPPPEVQVHWSSLGGPERPETIVHLGPDAAGAVFTGAVVLPVDGWWQANVVITPANGITSRARFWLVSPDPNMTGRGPESEDDVAATSLFERGLATLTSWRSVRLSQRLNDGEGSLTRTRGAVGAATSGGPATSSEAVIDDAGDVVAQQRIVGDRRWILSQEEGWIEATPIAVQTPATWAIVYRDATGFQLGPRDEVDGELCQIITFWQRPLADPARTATWFAWWVGLASGQVRREAMVSAHQYTVTGYSDFDAPLDITPPVTSVPHTPAATPRGGRATPVATPAVIGSTS